MSKEKKIITRWKELPYLFKVQLIAFFISGICGAISYPVTTKIIYSSVDTNVLAERLVISSCVGLVLSWLWLTIQGKLYKQFVKFSLIEFCVYTGLVAYVIISEDYNSYLIWSTIIGATIGHIVNGGGQKLHQRITDNEQYRTDYLFFIEVISSIGVLIGSAIAVCINISIPIGFILLLISLVFFEVIDIYVYKKVEKK